MKYLKTFEKVYNDYFYKDHLKDLNLPGIPKEWPTDVKEVDALIQKIFKSIGVIYDDYPQDAMTSPDGEGYEYNVYQVYDSDNDPTNKLTLFHWKSPRENTDMDVDLEITDDQKRGYFGETIENPYVLIDYIFEIGYLAEDMFRAIKGANESLSTHFEDNSELKNDSLKELGEALFNSIYIGDIEHAGDAMWNILKKYNVLFRYFKYDHCIEFMMMDAASPYEMHILFNTYTGDLEIKAYPNNSGVHSVKYEQSIDTLEDLLKVISDVATDPEETYQIYKHMNERLDFSKVDLPGIPIRFSNDVEEVDRIVLRMLDAFNVDYTTDYSGKVPEEFMDYENAHNYIKIYNKNKTRMCYLTLYLEQYKEINGIQLDQKLSDRYPDGKVELLVEEEPYFESGSLTTPRDVLEFLEELGYIQAEFFKVMKDINEANVEDIFSGDLDKWKISVKEMVDSFQLNYFNTDSHHYYRFIVEDPKGKRLDELIFSKRNNKMYRDNVRDGATLISNFNELIGFFSDLQGINVKDKYDVLKTINEKSKKSYDFLKKKYNSMEELEKDLLGNNLGKRQEAIWNLLDKLGFDFQVDGFNVDTSDVDGQGMYEEGVVFTVLNKEIVPHTNSFGRNIRIKIFVRNTEETYTVVDGKIRDGSRTDTSYPTFRKRPEKVKFHTTIGQGKQTPFHSTDDAIEVKSIRDVIDFLSKLINFGTKAKILRDINEKRTEDQILKDPNTTFSQKEDELNLLNLDQLNYYKKMKSRFESIFADLDNNVDAPTVHKLIKGNPFLKQYSMLLSKQRELGLTELQLTQKEEIIEQTKKELSGSDEEQRRTIMDQIKTNEDEITELQNKRTQFSETLELLQKWETQIIRITRDLKQNKSVLVSTLGWLR